MARETYASKVTFFPKTGETYGTPVQLKWCTNFKTKNNYKTSEQKADGTIEKVKNKLESVDIELGLSSQLPLEIECKLTGAEFNKGMKIVSSNTVPVEGAIAYEIADDDGNAKRRRVLTNVTLNKDERENSTDSEGEEFKFSGKAIADTNGVLDIEIDQEEMKEDASIKALWDKFFTEVISKPTA